MSHLDPDLLAATAHIFTLFDLLTAAGMGMLFGAALVALIKMD